MTASPVLPLDDHMESSAGEGRVLPGGASAAASGDAPRKASWRQSFVVISVGEPGDRPWFNGLLAVFPFAIASRYAGWGDISTFVLSLLAIVPLAERLGFVTECLADQTNDVIGALMNASMGNLPELIIAIVALFDPPCSADGTPAGCLDSPLRVVQISLLGSIISNLLLVMGTSFLVGGIRHSEQVFNRLQTHTGSVTLLLAVA